MAERWRNYLDREEPALSTVDARTGADRLLDRLRAVYREPRVDTAPQLFAGPLGMIALTDKQLEIVMTAATPLPPEKRALCSSALRRTCSCMAAAPVAASAMPMSDSRYPRRCRG